MPMYPYTCKNCNHVEDLLFRRSYSIEERQLIVNGELYPEDDSWAREVATEGHACERCGGTEHYSAFASLNKDSSWSSTGSHGVNGYFSAALGKHVDSKAAEKKIMEKKGFVCEAGLPQHYWEDLTEKSKEKKFAQSKLVDTYKEKLDAGKTKEEAVAETFTAQDAISGKLDETFNESLL